MQTGDSPIKGGYRIYTDTDDTTNGDLYRMSDLQTETDFETQFGTIFDPDTVAITKG